MMIHEFQCPGSTSRLAPAGMGRSTHARARKQV
eukprot:COSAG02_NODE_64735_length_259_cov_1.893750_1_plen_32_part_01